jgi:hypothetical protein
VNHTPAELECCWLTVRRPLSRVLQHCIDPSRDNLDIVFADIYCDGHVCRVGKEICIAVISLMAI